MTRSPVGTKREALVETRNRCGVLIAGGVIGFLEGAADVWAQGAVPAARGIDSGDTAWMLTASALGLAMIAPGITFFSGRLVRSKNVIGTMVQSFAILCAVSLIWVICGCSLAFGPDRGGVIGGLDWAGLSGVGATPNPAYGPAIPHTAFILFQLLFASFTSALIIGAFAERMKFRAMLAFAVLWSLFVYAPLAHWIWGGGWLSKLGTVDFAGGTVVHIGSGLSALACALVVGQRRGWRPADYIAPHNLPYGLLGAGLLWVGWFGFNGGSARGANAAAVNALVVTHLTAATTALSWMIVEWQRRGKPTVLGVASGAVAGLATSIAGAGFVGPNAAILIGLAVGGCSYLVIVWKGRIGYDDTLDVVGTHGIGGGLGTLAVEARPRRSILSGRTVCSLAIPPSWSLKPWCRPQCAVSSAPTSF